MKVVIIGLGSIAKKHISALRNIDESIIIYGFRSNRNAGSVSEVINIYSLNEINEIRPDFILISNPTSLHYGTILKLLPLEIPLFIEKPVFDCLTAQNIGLINQINERNISTYVACNMRFLDCIKKVKQIIDVNKVNEVNVYCGSYLPDWRPGVNFRDSYSARKELGGGVHIDLIHELDYIYWIFGEPIKTRSFFSSNSSLNITAYDYANYLWTYDDFSVSVVLNYFRKDKKRTLEIVTDDDTFLIDLNKNKIYLKHQIIFDSSQVPIDTYTDQMRFYISEILQGNKEFNTINEGYKVLELCLRD